MIHFLSKPIVGVASSVIAVIACVTLHLWLPVRSADSARIARFQLDEIEMMEELRGYIRVELTAIKPMDVAKPGAKPEEVKAVEDHNANCDRQRKQLETLLAQIDRHLTIIQANPAAVKIDEEDQFIDLLKQYNTRDQTKSELRRQARGAQYIEHKEDFSTVRAQGPK